MKKIALKALDLMTTSDVARELGVTIRTVQLWEGQGLLEGWKTPGGHRRITRASFNRLAEGKTGAKKITPATRQLKVVVVEDDPTLLKLYRLTIDSWNMPIAASYVDNGMHAMISIAKDTPDLLITDLRMPEMDGFKMLNTLWQADQFSRMAIMVVSGMPASEIEERGGLPRGVRVYGKTPIPFWEMKEYMQGLLDKKNALS